MHGKARKAVSLKKVRAYMSTRVFDGIRFKDGAARDAQVDRAVRARKKANERAKDDSPQLKFG